jgi:cystathionine beta-lyase/cystathionine gamma-synthase
VVTSEERRAQLNELNKLIGSNLGPQEAWLILRGLKTLPLRMQRQCESAAIIADWLTKHPKVSKVHYPGLPEHPQHLLAARILERGVFGAMISFDLLSADRDAAFRFLGRLRLVLPATTLGALPCDVVPPQPARRGPPQPRNR